MQSLDLIRIECHAINIPSYLPLDESSTVVNYAHTHVGDLVGLLPQRADMHTREAKGIEAYDRIEFTHCRHSDRAGRLLGPGDLGDETGD